MRSSLKTWAAFGVLILAAVPPDAAKAQQRRSGLWEVAMGGGAGPASSLRTQSCVGDAGQQTAATYGVSGACTRPQITPAPGGVTFHFTCKEPGGTREVTGKSVGDFQSAYTVTLTTTRPGAPPRDIVIKARYVGACPSGMKPGDILMNGMMIHAP